MSLLKERGVKMARQKQPVEVNTFVRGLITEASPLTFPDNASLDEDNFVLKRDGSRERRLGMDYETNYQKINTGITNIESGELALSTFTWKNAGGISSKNIVVVQTGQRLDFFDVDQTPLSSGLIHTETFTEADEEQIFSYTVVDGILVVVTGQKLVQVLEYDGSNISRSSKIIRIRDQFGIEDTFSGTDLTEGVGITLRPTGLTQGHRYNLRNQSWGLPRERDGGSRAIIDPIQRFHQVANKYPSNADNLNYVLYPNANDEDNRTGDQFYPEDLKANPPGSFLAPQGFFIIDALERGSSRIEEVSQLYSQNPELAYSISSLPTDKTPGGATCVSEYAGRVWYGGFSGQIIDGDNRSPKLSSYVFYSQLVQSPSNIGACYQEGDPTSKESSDLVDTDGGYIRIDGAYNIQRLVNVGSGLIVLAENGTWMITGGSDYGFTATNNMRRKLSEHGADSPGSVVVVDNTILFWADDAIYHVAPDQFGDYQAQNLTQTTIQTFYDQIDPVDKLYAQGSYDSYERKVRWVYQNRLQTNEPSRELILDLTINAFYTSTIGQVGTSSYPKVASPIEISPFRLSSVDSQVIYEGTDVVYNGEAVTQALSIRGQGTREIAYLTITGLNPVEYTFSLYLDTSFRDWVSEDGVGVDAPAYLVTGYLSGGDFQRSKQVPYITFHFTRTEDGFVEDGTGNLFPTNQSSCKVQAQWEWTNSANSNRWGKEFEAYRYRRLYSPSGPSDPFDNGHSVISTKNKLRGHGAVLSLKISTSPEKDCKLLGWSMLLGVPANV